jgi:hypothetical protein
MVVDRRKKVVSGEQRESNKERLQLPDGQNVLL